MGNSEINTTLPERPHFQWNMSTVEVVGHSAHELRAAIQKLGTDKYLNQDAVERLAESFFRLDRSGVIGRLVQQFQTNIRGMRSHYDALMLDPKKPSTDPTRDWYALAVKDPERFYVRSGLNTLVRGTPEELFVKAGYNDGHQWVRSIEPRIHDSARALKDPREIKARSLQLAEADVEGLMLRLFEETNRRLARVGAQPIPPTADEFQRYLNTPINQLPPRQPGSWPVLERLHFGPPEPVERTMLNRIFSDMQSRSDFDNDLKAVQRHLERLETEQLKPIWEEFLSQWKPPVESDEKGSVWQWFLQDCKFSPDAFYRWLADPAAFLRKFHVWRTKNRFDFLWRDPDTNITHHVGHELYTSYDFLKALEEHLSGLSAADLLKPSIDLVGPVHNQWFDRKLHPTPLQTSA